MLRGVGVALDHSDEAQEAPREPSSSLAGDPMAALDALPEQFRLAVYLADVESFSYKEIAEILDIPIGTVMSRLHRGRKALEKRLWDVVRERGLVRD